jgi:hypothetical protein
MTEEDKAQIHSLIVSRMDRLEDKLDTNYSHFFKKVAMFGVKNE